MGKKKETKIIKEQKNQLKVLLYEVLSKLEETRDVATELDHAYHLDIDIDDLEDIITEVENICNDVDGTN